MKLFTHTKCFIALMAMASGISSTAIYAADQATGVTQRTFASPEEAITALQDATQSEDKAALDQIFGPGVALLRTGDAVEDANHRDNFAKALAEGCKPVAEGDDKVILEVGTTNWPFPIPLVKADSQWRFDTDAGREEIMNRHIGEDELNAIGVCNAYVAAQRKYASLNPENAGETAYALKFKSTPGKKDGLYWEGGDSPFEAVVAEAHAEGYGHHKAGAGPKPFHGYYFRILTRQGKDAPGGRMSYMHQGKLSKGFALVAYPVRWDQSGVMTFIVNQDGKISQRNLGEKTVEIASTMKEYNPDSNWTAVEDEGVLEK